MYLSGRAHAIVYFTFSFRTNRVAHVTNAHRNVYAALWYSSFYAIFLPRISLGYYESRLFSKTKKRKKEKSAKLLFQSAIFQTCREHVDIHAYKKNDIFIASHSTYIRYFIYGKYK